MNNEKRPEGEIRIKSPFIKKLDNFFYHYKWHSIIAAFLAIVLLVCCVQTCSKEKYDIEIMYAGPYDFYHNVQTRLDIESAFSDAAADAYGNANAKANLIFAWVDEEYESTNVPMFGQTSQNGRDIYTGEIQAGSILIYLLSPDLFYDTYYQNGFMPIDELIPDLPDDVYYKNDKGQINRCGILLSATSLGDDVGFSNLPKDTILCIRTVPYSFLNRSRAKKQHNAAKKVFISLLSEDIVTTED